MASAILYNSRNDQNHSNPNFTPNFTHSNFNFTTFQNPNFTHFNHISRQPHHFPAPEKPGTHIYRQPHHPKAPEKPCFQRATNSNGCSYITFRLNTFSERELRDLKKRLVSDLHRVRVLRQRIDHDLTGLKRPSPSPSPLPLMKETTKKQKSNVKNNNVVKKGPKKGRKNDVMKSCMQILGKLMMHKYGWVFNTPVDIIGMKLYDYNDIIKKPMDLGTIKGKVERNEYNGDCFEFANDVRLTFNNAMVYNGKGSDVYGMAEALLSLFEGLFSRNVNLGKKKKRNGKVTTKVENAVEVVRNVVEKTNRREMTAEEKQKLTESLMSMNLVDDGMDELVRILKGRALGLTRLGDEIEIDIGVIDDETLWELRSFIDEKKKKMGCFLQADKMGCFLQADNCIVSEPEGVMEEEDVDIGEEIQLTNYTSVEIEKDSGSSSSDSDSSSSGSSSSDCSSRSGYNEQEANSTPIMGN